MLKARHLSKGKGKNQLRKMHYTTCTCDALVSRRRKNTASIYIHTCILIAQMVVVMAGDDGDEQRSERTEHNRKGL